MDPLTVLRSHVNEITSVSFNHDGNLLFSGDLSGEFKVWNVSKRRTCFNKKILESNSSIIGIESIKNNSEIIFCQNRDGVVKGFQILESNISDYPLYSVQTESFSFCKFSILNQKNQMHDNIQNSNNKILFSSNPIIAVSGNETSTIDFWDINSNKLINKCVLNNFFFHPISKSNSDLNSNLNPKNGGMCMSMQLLSHPHNVNSIFLLSGYESGHMALWDLRNVSSPLILTRHHSETILTLKVDNYLNGISGGADKETIFFNLNHLNGQSRVLKKVKQSQPGISDIAIRSDLRIAVTGGWDKRIHVYDYKKIKSLGVLNYHNSQVSSLDFSSNGILASSSHDKTIALWSLYPSNSK